MNYKNLSDEQKLIIQSAVKEKYPNTDVEYDKINFGDLSKDSLKLEYKGLVLEIPKPDQKTTNNIWLFVAGGVVAIVAVAVALKMKKD